jgi:hypothetical protein
MKCIIYFLTMLFFSSSIYGQITVETVTTDTIDIFSAEREQSKQPSSRAAIALSLLVPGLGHQYTDRPTSALAYLTIDALSLVGVIFFERYSRQLESEARGYASTYAGVHSAIKDTRFWQIVGVYNSSSEYNNDVLLAREQDDMYYNNEDYTWAWISDDLRNGYNTRRNSSRKLHIASAFCIGAMVLDRVIAFVDIRAATRYKVTSVHTSFSVDPVNAKTSIAITGEF